MREIEFLPAWYPMIRRRKRMVALQTWITVSVAVALGLWVLLAHRNVQTAKASLGAIQGQLLQTAAELQKLDQLIDMQKQLRQQDHVMAKVGVHVPASRLVNALDVAMPKEMALLDLSLETDEQIKPADAHSAQTAAAEPQRHLKVRLAGLAPTDVEVATFLARLTSSPVFDQVALSYARDRLEAGHVMREFEVTFSMTLNSGEAR